jgi:hypothetical protein
VADAIRASILQGAGLPFDRESHELLRKALYRLILLGSDGVYRAALAMVVQLNAADDEARRRGATVRGEALAEHRLRRAMEVSREYRPDGVMTAMTLLMNAMRTDVHGAVLVPHAENACTYPPSVDQLG